MLDIVLICFDVDVAGGAAEKLIASLVSETIKGGDPFIITVVMVVMSS